VRVTTEPRTLKAVAISLPTTPAPMIASRCGTSFADTASRLVQLRISASPGIGGSAALLPVATTTACRAVRVLTVPSGPVTATARGPLMRPCPRTNVMPAESSQSTCPSSCQCEANRSRRARTAATSNSPVIAAAAPGTCRAARKAATSRRRALVGMQAQ
jgi:hypothetical protein